MGGDSWGKFEPPWANENLLLVPPSVEKQLEASWQILHGEEPPGSRPPRVSKDKIREFVLDALSGALFLSTQIREHDLGLLPTIFLPLALGGLEGWTEEELKNIGVFYARMSTSLPRSINGYPIFPELAVLHRDDWAMAAKTLAREDARRKELEIG